MRAERALLATASGAVVAAIAYACLRAAEVALFPQANPAAIVSAAESAFVWRVALALYVGGMGGLGGLAAAVHCPALCARWIARGVVVATALAVTQAVVIP